MTTKTPEQIKDGFRHKGISVAQWAAQHGLNPAICYGLLNGQRKGTFGESHRAAVLLGLKCGEIVNPSEVKDAITSGQVLQAA